MKNYIILLFLVAPFLVFGQSNGAEKVSPCSFVEGLTPSDDVHCGQIIVPENHDDPTSKTIQISYVVIKAKNSTVDTYPMIYLTGGPGGGSISAGAVKGWSQSPIRNTRDIILFDQRGIGYSSGLPNIYKELYDIMAKDASEAEEQELMNGLIADYKQTCKDQKIQLQHYNSFQNAKDVGVMMKELGHKKYNLYGGSYGTRLARVVQEMYPELLNSVILNSPNPIKGDFLIDRLHSYSLALSRVFDYCKNDTDCNSNYPNLKTQYLDAINELKQNPLKIEVDNKTFFVNASDAIYFLRRKLYGNDSRTAIPLLISEYQKGDGPLIKQLITNEFGPGYNFAMWLAVERHEMYNPENTSAVIDDTYEKLELLPAKLGLFSPIYLAMADLHDSRVSEKQKTFKMSAVPTIIMVNQFDPVTPPENGHIMMKSLTNGQLFILDEGGHGGGNGECRAKIIASFMDKPTSKMDSSCLNLYTNNKEH